MNTHIRKIRNSDIYSVYNLVCELENTKFDYEVMKQIIMNVQTQDIIFVYELNNYIVGYLVLHITYQLHHAGKVSEVIELCVHPEYRNQNIGSELLKYVVQYSKEKGCVNIDITTNQKRKDAHRFYERHHFKQTHYKYTMNLKEE